jgi:hypothetical protein
MLCSPLGWFEMSNLPPDHIEQVAPLVEIRRAHRERLFSGTILPVGSPPDGVSWTGFVSVAEDRRSGYLLVFRELNQDPSWQTPITLFERAPYRTEILSGRGAAALADGCLSVAIPDALDYLFVRVDAE